MKAYISAELNIVRLENNIIATSGVAVGTPITSGTHEANTQRRSIWE